MQANAGLDPVGLQTLDHALGYVYFLLFALIFYRRVLLRVLLIDAFLLQHSLYVLYLEASLGSCVLYFYVPLLLACGHVSQISALVLKSHLPLPLLKLLVGRRLTVLRFTLHRVAKSVQL